MAAKRIFFIVESQLLDCTLPTYLSGTICGICNIKIFMSSKNNSFIPNRILMLRWSKNQCCESRSGWMRNFFLDPDLVKMNRSEVKNILVFCDFLYFLTSIYVKQSDVDGSGSVTLATDRCYPYFKCSASLSFSIFFIKGGHWVFFLTSPDRFLASNQQTIA